MTPPSLVWGRGIGLENGLHVCSCRHTPRDYPSGSTNNMLRNRTGEPGRRLGVSCAQVLDEEARGEGIACTRGIDSVSGKRRDGGLPIRGRKSCAELSEGDDAHPSPPVHKPTRNRSGRPRTLSQEMAAVFKAGTDYVE